MLQEVAVAQAQLCVCARVQRRLLEDVPLTEEEKKALLPAEFDPALHARLVEELKRLYVAVTRARNNVGGAGVALLRMIAVMLGGCRAVEPAAAHFMLLRCQES